MPEKIYKHKNFKDSLKSSLTGLVHIVKTGRNARIILILGAVALGLAYSLQLSLYEFALITLTVALVFTCEVFNTLLEDAIDLFKTEQDSQIKLIKDMASGAIFIASLASLGVALFIFLPKILKIFR